MLADKQETKQHERQLYRPAGINRTPGSMRGQPLGSKDLIIRMLAEVFHVSQPTPDCAILDGQQACPSARWQQVSTSLVPVSLYSRTTSKWLNYLLSASSMAQANTANAMSPDSRDFLLLLQQFHQQNQRQLVANSTVDEQQDGLQGLVVFQVVAHDYVGGQCKKILNAKLAQPGTRLGQASDHFVYWKDTNQQQMQFLLPNSSSFASNASQCRQLALNGYQMSTIGDQVLLQASKQTQQTWGLNFASVNDAKLFYDICSLNMVDLDFNSDYLKHLVVGDRQLMMMSSQYNQQQQQQQQQQYRARQSAMSNNQRLSRSQQSWKSYQASGTQPAFARTEDQGNNNRGWQQQAVSRRLTSNKTIFNRDNQAQQADCPVHSRIWQQQLSEGQGRERKAGPRGGRSSFGRVRSRSTTRQATSEASSHRQMGASLNRLRSISTPASPEHRNPECPVHSGAMGGRQAQNDEDTIEHHPQCSSLFAKQEPASESGHMRRPPHGDHFEEQNQPIQADQMVSSDDLIRRSQTSSKWPLVASSTESQDAQQVSSACEDNQFGFGAAQQSDQTAALFAQSRASQRRSTGVDSGNLEHLTNRNARLARAMYAKSKNMKEFLSLDIGGCQASPSRLAALNERFQKQQQQQQQQSRQAMGDGEQPDASSTSCQGLCNASTTTDDLPLDPVTKKRMFGVPLGSQEPISERTEPRSVSTSQQAELCEIKPVRAVSLGPERRGPRSEASRRRSLERSTCIDLDAGTVGQQSFATRASRLSPLAQSVSPLPPSVKSSPSAARQGPTLSPFNCTATRTRVGAAYLAPLQVQEDRLWNYDRFTNGPTCGHGLPKERTSSFKSAPDVTRLCQDDELANRSAPINLTTPMEPNLGATGKFSRLNSTGLSSYAVPLCQRDQDGIQYQIHSCPGSLRRQKRRCQQHCDQTTLAGDATFADCCCSAMHMGCHLGDSNADFVLSTPICRRPREFTCAHCSSLTDSNLNSGAKCAGTCYQAAKLNWPPCGKFAKSSKLQLQCQQQHHCQHSACMNNVICDGTRMAKSAHGHTLVASDCVHPSPGLYRACSSLSSRSPLRLGLYESDAEDDEEQIMPGPNDELTCHQAASTAGDLVDQQHQAWRLRQLGQSCPLKPVEGYDQTMARTSLKTRRQERRAKSQPPPLDQQMSSSATHSAWATADEAHLSKSVENVQKLIREVQLELNQLSRRRPLAGVRLSGSQVSPMDDGEDGAKAAGKAQVIPGQERAPCCTKMSEENNLPCGLRALDQQSHHEGRPQLTSSSTRRAGQFKCVGAIRKAGFLSVKKWIIKRRQSIELARKQGWKRYWVCLRGTALLFHAVLERPTASQPDDYGKMQTEQTDLLTWIQANCGSQLQVLDSIMLQQQQAQGKQESLESTRDQFLRNMSQCFIEREPRHLIIIEGAIAQPIPEHPKRDHVFCLSTTFGDAYLFQSSCQLESDNWIAAIHNACAASIARDLTRDETVKLFETKIRKLELEAEKKLFLRHRLESRLTSMSSMGHGRLLSTAELGDGASLNEHESKRVTLSQLLARLNQQLLTLDSYMEQLHCEIYQLRCYLASCANQHTFQQGAHLSRTSTSPILLTIDLPHPKSLLMHASRATKLVLIKLGIFIVSSLHAYIYARQVDNESVLQKMQELSQLSGELRLKSQSMSELLLDKTSKENVELEKDTEQLIQMSDLRAIAVLLNKRLLKRLESPYANKDFLANTHEDSDERNSIYEQGDYIVINLRMHSNSCSITIIKQVFNILRCRTRSEFDSLKYYLRFVSNLTTAATTTSQPINESGQPFVVAKRRDTLADWANLDQLELIEKIVFKVELNKSQIDDEVAPFGISIGAQLFLAGHNESLLNVYCSYIEWGSAADKACLKDDDEILVMNGVPVQDLDMMFVESIIQDESKLSLVIRSSRLEAPANSTQLDPISWQPFGGRDSNNNDGPLIDRGLLGKYEGALATGGSSQLISDEYVLSLVCPPPPPTQSSAFSRTNSALETKTLMRHKCDWDPLEDSQLSDRHGKRSLYDPLMPISKSKSQHFLDNSSMEADTDTNVKQASVQYTKEIASSVCETEKFTELAGGQNLSAGQEQTPKQVATDSNALERLKKTIIELFETEHAYIRHLESISELYIGPLEDTAFLSIPTLRQLNQVVEGLTKFQRGFFKKLTSTIESLSNNTCPREQNPDPDQDDGAESGADLEEIFNHLDSFKSYSDFEHILNSIANTFNQECELFKIYSIYCTTYSRLQKLLHPKRNRRLNLSGISIVSMPTCLDTFIISNNSKFSTSILPIGSSAGQHKELIKPLGSLISASSASLTGGVDQSDSQQLKQLSEFLGNLDTSSSSASLSLPKSNTSDLNDTESDQKRSAISGGSAFQKSTHQQSFESYLIKPIQRIVKYPMLLNSIAVAASALNDNITPGDLQQAVSHMESMASHVNDTQRIYEEYGLIFDRIERQFYDQQFELLNKSSAPTLSGPHQPPISLDIEQLLFSGPVEWLNISEFAPKLKKGVDFIQMLFVFNSCVLFICMEQLKSTKKPKLPISQAANATYSMQTAVHVNSNKSFQKVAQSSETSRVIRYHSLIPVSEVQVRSVPSATDVGGSNSRYKWELFRCSSVNSNSSLLTKQSNKQNSGTGKVYLLSCLTNDIRNAFLRKIRFIIRESVRNMSLPLARTPSSKSLTPKKLSPPTSETNSSCSHSISQSIDLQLRGQEGEGSGQMMEESKSTLPNDRQQPPAVFALTTVGGL